MKRTNTAKWVESRRRWQINVQKDGIRKTFVSSKPGRTGQAEANRKADRWLDDGIENTKIKVKQASEQYIESLKLSTSKSHWIKYECFFSNHINPYIGTVRIENITEQHLQSVIDRAYGKGLAKKSLMNLCGCLVSFVKYCRRNKLTSLLPEGLTIPREAKVCEKHILQPKDLKTLFSETETVFRGKVIQDPLIYAYRFHVLTGLRPGELAGLKWSDIKDGNVYLRRSINILGETTTGKNQNAQRNFALNIFTSAILAEQKKQLAELEINSEYVFCDKWGDPIKSANYCKRWSAYRDYHNMPSVTPYELRHTFVSAVKSLPEGYLKRLVGHSKDMDTYGVYSHEMDGDMSETAALVQGIFSQILAG
ncbi:MAG: site-specific integrase [Oscillospiraceae bacterium]|nr:site-specific integrase [Oscillospiraceae bacterium]